MDNKKYLIREFFALCENGYCEDVLNESEKTLRRSGTMVLSGKLSEADRKNGNGRIYPYNTLKREVENYQHLISDKRALGTLDHDESEIIELKNASHMVLRTWWDQNSPKTLMGTIKVLSTPSGKILEALINDGVKVGISSRGVGSVNETQDGIIVEQDFVLLGFDVVQEPSSQNAFMMLSESKLTSGDIKKFQLPKNIRINNLIDRILKENKV